MENIFLLSYWDSEICLEAAPIEDVLHVLTSKDVFEILISLRALGYPNVRRIFKNIYLK